MSEDPGPREDPEEEPSHPWARPNHPGFDWERERERQRREGARFRESDEERRERLRSILP